jgi:hypothetical protein
MLKLTLKSGGYLEYTLAKTVDALPIIAQHKGDIANVEIINGTLDDVFLNLTEGFEYVD